MSPRQGGAGRVIPDDPPGPQQVVNPNAPAVTADTPPPFYGRQQWTGGGLPGSGSATPERTIAFSTTVLDSVIPFVYGVRRVIGACCGRGEWTGQLRPFAYVFAHGEQDSITDFEINGEAASGLSWVSAITFRYGTGSETIPTGFTSFGTDADWGKYAYVCFKIDTLEAEVPGSLDITAVLGGQKIYDFRDTTTAVSSNPALIAYDIQTNDYWKGLAATRLDTDQWEPFADWCDDAMGDATARFEFNGVIYQRDPEAAMTEVLGHAFANWYFGADGKIKIWSEMKPAAITGDWSVAGTSVTEDASGGAATSELEVDDIVYIGTAVRTVVTVPDDDTFTIDSSLTVSAQKVRPTSGVYLRKENLIKTPIGHNTPPGSIPDIVIVNHTQNNDWGSYRYPAPGDIGVNDDKREEISFSGITSASQAKRTSEMSRLLRSTQPFHWQAIADGTAAGLEPGDIYFFDDDSLTMQAARVLPPLVWLTGGAIVIESRKYSPSSLSISTASDETPPVLDSGWVTDDPDAPTAATQTFGESGDWATPSRIPDPDDLTGWTDAAGISGAYSAPNDLTTFTVSTPATATSDYAIGMPGTSVLVTGLVKTSDSGFAIQLVDTNLSATKASFSVDADGEWHRFVFVSEVGNANSVRVGGIEAAATDTLEIRRVHVVEWNHDPSLTLYERWDWTEHGSASDSVDRYEMVDADNNAILMIQVPQGAVTLEHVHLILGIAGRATQWGTGTSIEATMLAVGPNGGTVAFPTPTQAIEARTTIITVDPSGFDNILGSGDSDIDTALATIDSGGFPLIRSTKTKTLTSGAITELLRLFCASDRSNGAVFWYHLEVTDGSANTDSETGLVSFSVERPGGAVTANAPVKGVTDPGSGAATVVFANGAAGADHCRFRVTATTAIGTPTLTLWMMLLGATDQAVTWS